MSEKQKTILIVDDLKDLRESLAVILEDEDYHTVQASQGVEAMVMIKRGHIDLLIADILMPEMDGIELADLVKKTYPDMKMILISGGGKPLVSGNSHDYLSMASTLTGVEHVLKKPFNPEDLIDLVHKLLED